MAAAIDHGFSHFDTAPYYGFGLSEIEVGKALRLQSADISVATKIGLYPPGGRASNMTTVWFRKLAGKLRPEISRPVVDWTITKATQSLEQSLSALKRDRVDILFLHEPAPEILAADEFLMWIERQRDNGKIRFWGLAGEINQFSRWVNESHPLAQVLQVRDSVDDTSNQLLKDSKRPFQFTYGYLSAHKGKLDSITTAEILQNALKRNTSGSVLVSTRHVSHLHDLARVAT